MVLEQIYEQDFYDCSYGFRPGRSAHQALQALWRQMMAMGGGWVVEVDIRNFLDTLDHARRREFLHRRVRDGVLLRLIGKWLHAGVLEGNVLTIPEQGTPQGGVITPPTILRIAPRGAKFKMVWAYLVDDPDLLFTNFHLLDQGA